MKSECIKAMDQCIRHLTTALSTACLYDVAHQQVLLLCRKAHANLTEALGGVGELSLMRVDEQLAFAGQPLAGSFYVDRFARTLKGCGIGHIKILNGVTFEELRSLVNALARRDLTIRSSEHLRLGQVEVRSRDNALEGERLKSKTAQFLEDVSSEELARIMEVYEAVSRERKLHVVGLTEIVDDFIDIFASSCDPFLALVPLRTMDEYTFTHSLNVCLLNIGQAAALGIDGPLLNDIGLAAMLHDVGKLLIPKEILNKTERLDSEEWNIMKGHPVKGAEYLVKTPGVPRMAVLNAYEHHLRFDLRGYPAVNSDWQQNLCSQITSISDVYDALRTHRPYRQPLEVDEVLDLLTGLSGSQLHPLLVENFHNLIRRVHPSH